MLPHKLLFESPQMKRECFGHPRQGFHTFENKKGNSNCNNWQTTLNNDEVKGSQNAHKQSFSVDRFHLSD